MIGNIKGIIDKVASRKLAVTAAAGAAAVEITLPVAIVAAAYIMGQAMVDASGD
jgi:hypothetical protein